MWRCRRTHPPRDGELAGVGSGSAVYGPGGATWAGAGGSLRCSGLLLIEHVGKRTELYVGHPRSVKQSG